jgi:hypothetical protein
MDFLTASFLYLVVTMALKTQNIDEVLAWKSGHKVSLLVPLEPSCPLQAVLLNFWSGVAARCSLKWPFERRF